MEVNQNDRFLKKFGWVQCIRCSVSLFNNQQMMVLTCRHTFCTKCFQIGCTILDPNRKTATCYSCKKPAKYAPFSENLPAKFLKPFEKIDPSSMMRAAQFQEQQWKWNLSNMAKKAKRKMDQLKEKKSQLEQKRASNMKLKQQHDAMYQEMLKYWSSDEIERLLSHTLDEVKNMDISPERKSPESSSSSSSSSSTLPRHLLTKGCTIDENSPTSLYRQVLVKNASSSSSHNTLNSSFPNLQQYIRVRHDSRPNNIHLSRATETQVHASHRHQNIASQRQDAHGSGVGRGGHGTDIGYHPNVQTATANKYDAHDNFKNF